MHVQSFCHENSWHLCVMSFRIVNLSSWKRLYLLTKWIGVQSLYGYCVGYDQSKTEYPYTSVYLCEWSREFSTSVIVFVEHISNYLLDIDYQLTECKCTCWMQVKPAVDWILLQDGCIGYHWHRFNLRNSIDSQLFNLVSNSQVRAVPQWFEMSSKGSIVWSWVLHKNAILSLKVHYGSYAVLMIRLWCLYLASRIIVALHELENLRQDWIIGNQ